MKAKYISTPPDHQGCATRKLYQVSPPVTYAGDSTTHYLAISAADTLDEGGETMAFPADKDGEVLDWMDLAVIRPDMDHDKLLRHMGYEIVTAL